ncbi:hypothetical protein ACFPJ4_05595 [Lysinimonas soli]|uniref:Glycosyltransferase RgtA/B/C/D-like domain-containing protein n=1 Tax=Lysinimonas soli TaxID=1074233 RepID=A0ABW0NP57_9MICO
MSHVVSLGGVEQRDRTDRRPDRTRLDAFPRDPLLRWALRLAFAVPYLLVAWVGSAGANLRLTTPNQQLIDRIATIDWNRADVSWISDIFPPLSTLLAAAIPGGRAGLAVAGALVAGVFLQRILEVMVQRRFAVTTTVILMLALAANPLFAYNVTENFPAFLGLAFFGLGIADVVRFVAWGNTQSGFRAGLLLMLATLSDLSGVLYVLTAAAAAPFLRHRRADQVGARRANVLVIVFPTAAAIGAIGALNLIFTGRILGSLGRGLLAGVPERFETITAMFTSIDGLLLAAPVLSAWVIGLIVRRPGSIVVSTLVFVAVLGASTLGLVPSGSAGNTFILMTLMAIALIPTARERFTIALVDVVAVLQIAIAWAIAFNRPVVLDWMHALSTALSAFPH